MDDVQEFYVTFGVQYDSPEKHILGMVKDGYAVIEAPNRIIARRIAAAIFGTQWAFLYPKAEFIDDGKAAKWHPRGELLRIKWVLA